MSTSGSENLASNLIQIGKKLENRGPDGSGQWFSHHYHVGLVHRRLSIIDLSNQGAQPMVDRLDRYVISFNGEIYNYKEIRKTLEREHGCRFFSDSDTEVLLNGYIVFGSDLFQKLRGMFAAIIFDKERMELIAFRDHFGIKPLYYTKNSNTWWLSSQVKSLLGVNGLDKKKSEAAKWGFLLLGSIPEPFTTYHAIRELPAGSWMVISQDGNCRIQNYYSLKNHLLNIQDSPVKIKSRNEYIENIKEALKESILAHTVSDAKIGMFLSAGFDSSIIAQNLTHSPDNFEALTIDFSTTTESKSEVGRAKLTADYFKIHHYAASISKKNLNDFKENIFVAMDQPSIDGINLFCAASIAKERGFKVMLSGVGGDELFRSYPTFRRVPIIVKAINTLRHICKFKSTHKSIVHFLNQFDLNPRLLKLFDNCSTDTVTRAYMVSRELFSQSEVMENSDLCLDKNGYEELQLEETMYKIIEHTNKVDDKVFQLEVEYYLRNQLLRDSDWSTMAHSIELRIPLVDIKLYNRVLPIIMHNNSIRKNSLLQILEKPIAKRLRRDGKLSFNCPTNEMVSNIEQNKVEKSIKRLWPLEVYKKHFTEENDWSNNKSI